MSVADQNGMPNCFLTDSVKLIPNKQNSKVPCVYLIYMLTCRSEGGDPMTRTRPLKLLRRITMVRVENSSLQFLKSSVTAINVAALVIESTVADQLRGQ